MPTEEATVQTKSVIPLWLAIAITVCVALPFGIWFNSWNLPIWVSFIVWAEYFALGAKASALTKIVPAYLSGVGVAAVIMTLYVWLSHLFSTYWVKPTDLALGVAAFVGFSVFIYAMKYIPFWANNTLPFFNGVSMGLAVYFTSAFVHPFPATASVYALPWIAAVGAALAGLLGAFLGWFNVAIMFTHPVTGPDAPAIEHIPATDTAPTPALGEPTASPQAAYDAAEYDVGTHRKEALR
jgi:hypothetical protein